MIRVERELGVSADQAYEVFCDVGQLAHWVPELTSVDVQARHPDGRASVVAFGAVRASGRKDQYRLSYAYDVAGRRVMWGPVVDETRGIKGFAKFEPVASGRCRVLYVMDMGTLDPKSREASTAAARGTVDAFEAYVAKA